jgi:alpha-beta hydrolase superfamily lysophospholipase
MSDDIVSDDLDLSFLDEPTVLSILFPLAYMGHPSLAGRGGPAEGAPESSIEVEAGIRVGYGFWVTDVDSPSLLYFHGNGETVDDYEWVASVYAQIGVNLFVVDYRGYGASDGRATFSNTVKDSRTVFRFFAERIRALGMRESLFVMGRSIGSIPACEVASRYQDEIRGLVIESGAANNFRYRWAHHRPARDDVLGDDGVFLNKVKLRQVTIPTLIIHGRSDDIVPFSEGEELYRNSAAEDKRLLAVARAGHNDLLAVDPEGYFASIQTFVKTFG